MENLFNAIIMVGSILLFLVGLSVGVYLYGRIMESNSQVLTTSEYLNKTAEHFTFDSIEETVRRISGAEIVNQYYDILHNLHKASPEHYAYRIVVDVNGGEDFTLTPPVGESYNPVTDASMTRLANVVNRWFRVSNVQENVVVDENGITHHYVTLSYKEI